MLVALQLDITSQCALCGQLTGVASNVALQLDITSQCALCGQLVGMFLFFTHMAGSPPIIFKLTRRKFAIKQLGRLLLVCIELGVGVLAVHYQ